ncbi:hypothetical protein [Streptomyces sp.]|uniref:hypothetical protein n=1 Tax=Streptomyces sp. TaxID=1931 RepID=UPI0039C91031
MASSTACRVFRIGVQHGRGERAADGTRREHVPPEALPELRLGGEVLMHGLDGHQPPGRRAGEMHQRDAGTQRAAA